MVFLKMLILKKTVDNKKACKITQWAELTRVNDMKALVFPVQLSGLLLDVLKELFYHAITCVIVLFVKVLPILSNI